MRRVYIRDTGGARRGCATAADSVEYEAYGPSAPSVPASLGLSPPVGRSRLHAERIPPGPDLFYLYKTIEVGKNPTSVITGDLNGDRVADLITTNIGSDSLSVLIGIGDGNFRDPVTIRMPEQPRAGVLHDFNEDGKLDLAVATAGNNRVTILLGDGTGQFTRGDSYPAVRSPVSLAVADFNGDRKADLAVALRNDKLLVLLGRGDGSFLQKAIYEYGDTPTAVVAADVNEDSLPDLVVTHGGKMSSSVVVF